MMTQMNTYCINMFGKIHQNNKGWENVEPDALKDWKISSFKIIDTCTCISFYSRNTLLPPKPKSSFRHLKRGIQDFHMKYVLVPADKAANNVVVVWRLYYVDALKRELIGTNAYKLQQIACLVVKPITIGNFA